jgi:SAM-dependent methyltransferase
MGNPTNEPDRNIFERPPATVTLTRGFWIGKYEVTQGEYLAVTGENPYDFPGDLRRLISSVSWFDATNYCWELTQQERAAGRIPADSQYRLPTESKVHGFDFHEKSIEEARQHAKEHKVSNIAFQTREAKDLPGKYDLITMFDCLHDMGDPVGALKHIRAALKPNGLVMID